MTDAQPLAIVTGANTGVGAATALGLALRGYSVILACRNAARGAAAADDMRAAVASAGGRATLHVLVLDLTSLASVVSFVSEVRQRFGKCHVLVCNAGMNNASDTSVQQRRTPDGFELCMASNYLGHYVLARLLLPLIVATSRDAPAYAVPVATTASAGGGAVTAAERAPMLAAAAREESTQRQPVPCRVVCLGSLMHRFVFRSQCDFTPTFYAAGDYTYNMSKFCMVLLAYELQHRLTEAGITSVQAIAVNPGAVNSDIWRHLPRWLHRVLLPFFRLLFLTTEQGAGPSIAAASDRIIDGRTVRGGEYVVPYYILSHREPIATMCEAVGPYAGPRVVPSQSLSYDRSLWSRLWNETETATLAVLSKLRGDASEAAPAGTEASPAITEFPFLRTAL